MLEALNQHAGIPILTDGSSGDKFTAQLDNLNYQGNSDDSLETQAARPHDLWASGDLKVTPRAVQTMGPGLTQLGSSEDHSVQDDRKICGNDKAMRIL